MAPPIAIILPFFLIARDLGLLDTQVILIAAYMSFNFGFVIWLLRGFFAEVPVEIDEAALVDGCSRVGAFVRVVLPLTAPGSPAAAIICFIFSWNEFLFALILTGIDAKTLPVTAAGFVTDRMVLWGNLCAAAVIILPAGHDLRAASPPPPNPRHDPGRSPLTLYVHRGSLDATRGRRPVRSSMLEPHGETCTHGSEGTGRP